MHTFLLLLIVIATPAFAGLSASDAPPTPEEIAANTARFNACFRGYGLLRNNVEVRVTTGKDGMIIGEPEPVRPIDSEEYRQDLETVLERIRHCQPYKYYPARKFQNTKTQPFIFPASYSKFDPQWGASFRRYLESCYAPPKDGPTIEARLSYNFDGSLNGRPTLISRKQDPAYLRNAAHVMESLMKCPPLDFPKEQYGVWRLFTFKFTSVEGPQE